MALYSCKSVVSLCTQKEEKENQNLVSTSNVYPRQANNLVSLQTIILQTFAKRVFREEAECCCVLRMKTNESSWQYLVSLLSKQNSSRFKLTSPFSGTKARINLNLLPKR